MADTPTGQSKVFISYSHRDKAYLDRLQEHLRPHVRARSIPLWVDTHLKPGDDWEAEIKRALESAQVAILLVSVSFLASDFVAEEELPKLLAAAEGRGARILPVILTPCAFRRTKLSRFQAVNDPAKALSGLSQHEQDVIWEQVVDAVLEALETPPARQPLGTLLATCNGHTDYIWDVAWSPDGSRLASASADMTVRLWDAGSHTLLATGQGHTKEVEGIAWSLDSSYLASASRDRTVRLWDVASGMVLQTCRGHTKWVRDVAWSPDGSHLASASADGTVRLWDATNGQCLFVYQGHTNQALSVAWSPDGSRIASTGYDKSLQVWSAG